MVGDLTAMALRLGPARLVRDIVGNSDGLARTFNPANGRDITERVPVGVLCPFWTADVIRLNPVRDRVIEVDPARRCVAWVSVTASRSLNGRSVRNASRTVHYRGDIVTHRGSTYQARCDTAREPPHEDWICVAHAGVDGKDGRDGRSLEVRGLFSDKETYKALDIVALNGGSFIAKKDNPGPCPGAGWQLIASQGKRGDKGERGLQGIPGVPVVIQKWRLDRDNYIAVPVMSDGREGPPLELRSLFEQFHTEAR